MAPIPNNDTPTTARKRVNAKSTAAAETSANSASIAAEKEFSWQDVAKHNSEVNYIVS